ncbi:polyprenyl synthetase family protein, partial [Nocardia sp. NPDC058497]
MGDQVAVLPRPSVTTRPVVDDKAVGPVELLPLVTERLHEILMTGGDFDAIYRHVLAAPGKRVRARLVLACAGLLPDVAAAPQHAAIDLACAMEMLPESALRHG